MSAKQRWNGLSPRVRRAVVLGAAGEGALKVMALIDLARRPPKQVRGPKPLWAIALVLVNSAGALPLYYLTSVRCRQAQTASELAIGLAAQSS
jgi:hypothetical protein